MQQYYWLVLFACYMPCQVFAATSKLWGTSGESYNKLTKDQRLLDYSYAGYAAGEVTIPTLTPTLNVKDFGAKGDGTTDDSNAFLAAIKASSTSVIRIPAGKYKITKQLIITSRISLIGDGSGTTTLLFPNGVPGTFAEATQCWVSYVGQNPNRGTKLVASITANAARGTNTIKVSTTAGLTAGTWISVAISSPSKDFTDMNHLIDPGCTSSFCLGETVAYYLPTRIASISGSDTIVLERPLPWNITSDYPARSVYLWSQYLSNVGVQGLTFQFSTVRYAGHFKETDRNALQFTRVQNSWIRDIQVIDADVGIYLFSSAFVTVSSITTTATGGRVSLVGQFCGHWGIYVKNSVDNLITDYMFHTKFVHDNAVDKFARGNVFSRGFGMDLNMDMHKGENYGNLFTQIDTGVGIRAFDGGGASGNGLAAGSFTTFWNVMRMGLATGPEFNFGPWITFVGVDPFTVLVNQWTASWYIETITPANLMPSNIFLAQQSLRLSFSSKVSSLLGGTGSGGVRLTTL